jgi:hypothetical protein
MRGKCGNPGLKGKILEKSIEAYILSLEIINQLSVKYRVETFTYLICNAWELLLKAKIIDSNHSCKAIYYKKERNKPLHSLALRDCLKKVFPNEQDPVRRNLEHIADLRDTCVHLIINQVPKDVLGLFQACVLNYHKNLNLWFSMSLSDRVAVGMMTIVYDFKPEEFDLHSPLLRKKLGRDTFQYLSEFQGNIQKEFDVLGKPAEFSIDIGYKLGLVKIFGEGDINLTQGDIGTTTGILQVPKDSSVTHPYRRKEIIEKLKESLPEIALTSYDVDCIVHLYQVKNRPEFYYQCVVPGSPNQYSKLFLDWILKEYLKNKVFFAETRRKVKELVHQQA